MYSKIVITAFLAIVNARFGQQNPNLGDLQALLGGAVGGPLSGDIPSTLLGGADPCAKLSLADKIAAAKPGDAAVLTIAKKLVNTESNFNPFGAGADPKFCNNPALPATPELRGILAQVSDDGLQQKFGANGGLNNDQINAIATKSLTNPLPADGLSVAQLYLQQGFKDFVGADKVQTPGNAANNQNTQSINNANTGVVTVTQTVTVDCAATPLPSNQQAQSNNQANQKAQSNNNSQGNSLNLAPGQSVPGSIFSTFPAGKQFTTGACTADSDCQSACCDGKKCRSPSALRPNVESCRNGLTTNPKGDGTFVHI
ncbi:hypothetical protein HDV04_005160 [Boothiomyces sp. JEL0838]|nr:hypothetical protein HDV04_005160 [Boothiomyces sp. JEL0838]